MADINEQLLFRVKADLDAAMKQFESLNKVILETQKAAAGLKTVKLPKSSNFQPIPQGTIKSWRDQIKVMEVSALTHKRMNAEYKQFVANERAKQNELNKSNKIQESMLARIKNGVLPGLGAGIGMAMANAGIKAIGAVVDTVRNGIEFNAFKESTTAMFKVLLKDGPQAVSLMDALQKKTLETSMSFRDAITSSKQLLAYGFKYDNLVSTMTMLGTVTAATGGRLDDLAYVYGTLRTQGRAYTRDIMQFAMRGIPIYEELANVLGVSAKEVKGLVENGAVGFGEVEKAFQNMTEAGGVFFGASEARLETLAGKWEMIAKKWEIVGGKIGEALEPTVTFLTDQIGILVDLVNKASSLSPTSGKALDLKYAQEYSKRGMERPATYALGSYITKDLSTGVPGMKAGADLQMGNYLKVINDYVKRTGMSQLEVAKAMYDIGKISYGTFKQVEDNILRIEDSSKRAADYWKTVVQGRGQDFASKVGIDPKAYAERTGTAAGSGSIYAGQVGISSMILKEMVIKPLEDGLKGAATLVEKTGNKAILEDAKDLADKSAKSYLDAAVAQYSASKAATDSGKLAEAQQKAELTNQDELLKFIRALAPFIEEKGKKAKEAKDDPFIYEVMNAASTVTQLDDAFWDLQKEIKSIEDAYKDTVGLTDKMNGAVALARGNFDRLYAAISKYEEATSMGSQIKQAGLELAGFMGDTNAEYKAEEMKFNLDQAKKLYDFEVSMKTITDQKDRDNAQKLFDLQTKLDTEQFKQETNMRRADQALTANPKFWDNIKAGVGESLKNGNIASAVGGQAAGALQGTDIGSLMAGANPIMMFADSIMKAMMQVESFAKVVNFVGTIVEEIFAVIGPTMQLLFEPLMFGLQMLGESVGQLIQPFAQIATIIMDLLYPTLVFIMLPLELLGTAFQWFSDKVIVPVGNAIIDGINSMIGMLNTIFGSNIKKLNRLQTSAERAAKALEDIDRKERLDALGAAIDYLKDKLKKETDSIVSSLQDLYEVGAISATEYESRSMAAMDALNKYDDTNALIKKWLPEVFGTNGIPAITTVLDRLLLEQTKMENDPNYTPNFVELNNSIGEINRTLGTQFTNTITAINGLITTTGYATGSTHTAQQSAELASAWQGTAWKPGTTYTGPELMAVPKVKFAVGTGNVPYDMNATVHKGETIIPETFADSIRKGDLALTSTKGSTSSGGDVYVTVNVSGSVQAENDLAATITQTINRQRRLGVLTV